jgi:hypothetical protein
VKRRKAHPNIADMMKAFGCIDAMLARLAEGWIHELQGAAVFKNPQDGVWYEIPAAMEGWIALWERLDARYDMLLDLDPARKIVARLRYGTPIPPARSSRGCATARRSRPSSSRGAKWWWTSASGRIGAWMCSRLAAW